MNVHYYLANLEIRFPKTLNFVTKTIELIQNFTIKTEIDNKIVNCRKFLKLSIEERIKAARELSGWKRRNGKRLSSRNQNHLW